jgi:hypothetical protein
MYQITCIDDLHILANKLNKTVKYVSFSYLDTACSNRGNDYRLTKQKTIYCFDENGKFIKTRIDSRAKKSPSFYFKKKNDRYN